MAKRKKDSTLPEMDDELYAQIGFLRNDYDNAVSELEQLRKDNCELMGILVKRSIPIPQYLVDRYVRIASDTDDELPFE